MVSLPLMSVVVAALMTGGALALMGGRIWHDRRVRPLQRRIDHLMRAQAQTNEMLLQARRQADVVQKALDLARRNATLQREPVLPANDSFILGGADVPRYPVFADTAIESRPSRMGMA